MGEAYILRRGGAGGLSPNNAVIHVTAPVGSTISFAKGGVTAKVLGPEKSHVNADDNTLADWYYSVSSSNYGTWTVTATLSGNTKSDTVTIDSNEQYDLSLSYHVPALYQEVEYLEVGNTAGPYIDTNCAFTTASEYEVKFQYTGTPGNETWLFGAYANNKATQLGYWNSKIYFRVGGSSATINFDTNIHTYKAATSRFIVDGSELVSPVPNWGNAVLTKAHIFSSNSDNKTNKCRIFFVKMWSNGVLQREMYPCYRKSDSVAGMWDKVSELFYTNAGTGTFTVGPDV